MSEGKKRSPNRLITLGLIGFIVLIVVIIFSNATFLTIDAGERGVLFRRFAGGLDTEKIYQPGFQVVAPWNNMYIFDVRENQLKEGMEVLSSNGLNIQVDVTIRINPKVGEIGFLYEKFGPDTSYIERLVRPETRSVVRQVIGQFKPEELYSTRRDEVSKLIQERLGKILDNNHINLKASLIRDIQLPAKVKTAIEDKLEAEQSALKYQYILDQERKEAERKIIEAEAKSQANRILNQSLTDKILQDKGIEATLDLAKSPNSKVVIVGGQGDGLPLILGGGN